MQNSLFPSKQPLAVALGTFDGLHRGHRAVIDAALTFGDSGMTPCVLLFDVHPQSVLDGHAPPEILTSAMRDKELEKAGIRTVKIPFESVRHLSAEAFIADVLVNDLGAAAVCCGYDYRFGHDATGNIGTLRELCARFGLRVLIADAVTYKGEAVSSTRIRACIEGGLIEDANEMLGRVFSYDFEVVGGDRLGRLLGAPTINQHFPDGFAVPKAGVYISRALVEGFWHTAVTNIGMRPTLNGQTLRSETCIMEFSGDLYGQHVEVGLIKYLREEIKFSSLDDLSRQIRLDAQAARAFPLTQK